MAKDKLTKKEAMTAGADMIYKLGQGLGAGTRGPGRFVDLLGGTGLAIAGTNREGVTGAIIGGKFVPTSENYYKAPGEDNDKEDGEDDDKDEGGNGNGNNQKTLIKPFKPFQSKLPLNAGWDRTIQKYLKPPGGGDKDNSTQSRGLFTGRAKIGNMKEGGLVRGAGKAERGRGRGKMV